MKGLKQSLWCKSRFCENCIITEKANLIGQVNFITLLILFLYKTFYFITPLPPLRWLLLWNLFFCHFNYAIGELHRYGFVYIWRTTGDFFAFCKTSHARHDIILKKHTKHLILTLFNPRTFIQQMLTNTCIRYKFKAIVTTISSAPVDKLNLRPKFASLDNIFQ